MDYPIALKAAKGSSDLLEKATTHDGGGHIVETYLGTRKRAWDPSCDTKNTQCTFVAMHPSYPGWQPQPEPGLGWTEINISGEVLGHE